MPSKFKYKVRVALKDGRQSIIGMMDPKVGMVTSVGTITAIDGYGLCTIGATKRRYHTHQMQILLPVATAKGWPTAPDCVVFGHKVHTSIVTAEKGKDYVLLGPSGVPVHYTYSG